MSIRTVTPSLSVGLSYNSLSDKELQKHIALNEQGE
jgi:hypothetical protein